MILQSPFDRDPKYVVVCVINRTDVPVAGEFGWGDNTWEPFRIDAEREKAFWWEYRDGTEQAPPFKVSYDRDIGPGASRERSRLETYRVENNDCDSGKQYIFRPSNGNFIKIYKR